jgi:hypothetical protein
MMTKGRVLLCMGLLVLVMALAESGFAQTIPTEAWMYRGETAEPGPSREIHKASAPPAGIPVGLVIGEGVAIKDNETHAFRIKVEHLVLMEPWYILQLLASNRSLDETRVAIRAKQGAAIYRGDMMLDQRIYPLYNIRTKLSADDASILEADVKEPMDSSSSDETAIVGHIQMTIALREGENVSKGLLQMNDAYYFGRYSVLLEPM